MFDPQKGCSEGVCLAILLGTAYFLQNSRTLRRAKARFAKKKSSKACTWKGQQLQPEYLRSPAYLHVWRQNGSTSEILYRSKRGIALRLQETSLEYCRPSFLR